MKPSGDEISVRSSWVNQDLILAYALPYLVYVALGEILGRFAAREVVYLIRLVVVSGLVYWAFRWYVPVTGPKNMFVSLIYGIIFGVLGLVLWCALCAPFVRGTGGDIWSEKAFAVRFFTAGFLVPVFEEWLMRGFVFRLALQWYQRVRQGKAQAFFHVLEKENIARVTPGDWSLPAMLISSLIFALGHGAHGVTNMGLALYVLYSGHWEFW